MLQSASHILADLTRFAGVVMTPRRRSTVLRHVEFLRLADKRILLILVTPDGDVQNRILLTDRAYSPSELIEAANFINQNFAGLTFERGEGPPALELKQLRDDMTQLLTKAVEAGNEAMYRTVGRLRADRRAQPAARARPVVQRGQPAAVVRPVRATHLAAAAAGDGQQGARACRSTSAESRAWCLWTSAAWSPPPTRWRARCSARSGVIGPTRMAYERVIPIVEITAKLLSMAMAQRVRALE